VRIVADTNILVSGLLWRGLPWQLMRLAEAKRVELCMTPPMFTELAEVLAYRRMQPRLRQLGLTAGEIVAFAVSLTSVFETAEGEPIVTADPDDDIFLRCAAAAGAAYVVSGDRHLLELGTYAAIPIVTVHDFFAKEFPHQLETASDVSSAV